MVGSLNKLVFKYYNNWSYTGIHYDISSQVTSPGGLDYLNGYWWLTDYNQARIFKYFDNWTYTNESYYIKSVVFQPVSIRFHTGYWWALNNNPCNVYKFDYDYNISKIYQNNSLIYIQTNKIELLTLQSPNNLSINLQDQDLIEVKFNTSSSNQINLTLSKSGVEQKSYILSPQGNNNYSTRLVNITVEKVMQIDQILITGLLNKTNNIIIDSITIYGGRPFPFNFTSDADEPYDLDGIFNLIWTNSTNAKNYTIYEHTSYIYEVNNTIKLTTVFTNDTYQINKTLDGIWYYKIVASNDYDNYTSECISVNIHLTPVLFNDLKVDYSEPNNLKDIVLSWSSSPNADNYSIYRYHSFITGFSSNLIEVKSGLKNNLSLISDLESGNYFFIIVAFNEYGNSTSNCVNITVKVPESPQDNSIIFMIIIITIILAAIGGISILGITLNKHSKERLRIKESEIAALKKQKDIITEDEIQISKEKHFCIVHKGPIEGYSFICPTCGAFYCQKCLEAIKDIENTCWSCNEALDSSIPTKTIKEKEFEAEIVEMEAEKETAIHKKSIESHESPNNHKKG